VVIPIHAKMQKVFRFLAVIVQAIIKPWTKGCGIYISGDRQVGEMRRYLLVFTSFFESCQKKLRFTLWKNPQTQWGMVL